MASAQKGHIKKGRNKPILAPLKNIQEDTCHIWQKLTTVPYQGKQDDIFMLDGGRIAFYGNGAGKFYRSVDAGKSWQLQSEKHGTFWRCIAFLDSTTGFAGNVGKDYFPGVTDSIPLYKTTNAGKTWAPVNISGGTPKGLCAIYINKVPFVNHGTLDYKITIFAAGRVGGPAWLMVSTDLGNSWQARNLENDTKMIFDIIFTSVKVGYICGATSTEVSEANAQVLRTTDGGTTWKQVYRSVAPFEMTWKASFPTKDVGYISFQNYNPDTTVKHRYIITTKDGGNTWHQKKLPAIHALRQFGIGFTSANVGYVGTTVGGFKTVDGGITFRKVLIGRYVNKFRFNGNGKTLTGYAIGADIYRLN